MGRKTLNKKDRKDKISVSLNKILSNKINKLYTNKSKYIERLVYQDLLKNNEINENFIL